MSDYSYRKVGETYSGAPVYLVLDGETEVGVIESGGYISTDSKIAGTRLRRPGRGRNGFRPSAGTSVVDDRVVWDLGGRTDYPDETRAAACWRFSDPKYGGPMPAEIIEWLVERAAGYAAEHKAQRASAS